MSDDVISLFVDLKRYNFGCTIRYFLMKFRDADCCKYWLKGFYNLENLRV